MSPGGRQLPASAVAGLLEAILHRCTDRDVCLACAAILAHGADPAAVTQYTHLLAGAPDPPLPPGDACQSCGATTDLDAVHFPAAVGIAARVEHYCHDATACHQHRHDHLVATSAVTG